MTNAYVCVYIYAYVHIYIAIMGVYLAYLVQTGYLIPPQNTEHVQKLPILKLDGA